jgi:hypothetical protein
MPYDSNGNASVTRDVAVTGQTVLAEQVNVPFADIQAMLSQVLLKSGVAPMTGPLNMNQSKIINVSDPTSPTDGANKEYVDAQVSTVNSGISSNARKIETVNANRLALLADKATSFRVTGARIITLTAAATLLANWWCEVWAVDGVVTIDPDAAETINGNATLLLNAGQKAIIFCTGTAFFAFVTTDAQSGVQLQGYSFGLSLSNNAVDASNDVDITSGKAASDTSPFNLMVLSGALTKRIDAAWSVGSGNGGFDTGGVSASGNYYLWLIQRSDTGVTDALFSVSNTSPTLPTSYDRKRLIGTLERSGSVNGPIMSYAPFGLGELSRLDRNQIFSFSGTQNELVFPIGQILTAFVGGSPQPRRALVNLYIFGSNAGDYTISVPLGGTSLLQGSWRCLGSSSDSRQLFQRVV